MSKKFWNDDELEVDRFEVNSRIALVSGIAIFVVIAILAWIFTK